MNTLRFVLLGGLITALLGGCAAQNVRPDDPVAVKVDQLSQRVDKVDRVLKNGSLQDLADRIDELQRQVQQLRGDVEELQHDMKGAKQRQRDLYLDVDRRLRALELGTSGSSQRGDGGGASEPAQAGADMAAVAGAAAGAGSSAGPAASDKGSQSKDVEATYEHDFDLLKQGRYQEAITAFSAFLKRYPSSSLADNAQYWLGEAKYVTRDFKQALVEFQNVSANYPHSSKVPDADLKVGYCQYELEQWAAARKTLQAVAKNYPDTTAAKLASQRLDRMKREGH